LNQNGQLGTPQAENSAVPLQVPGLEAVRDVAAGFDMTCVLNQTGELRCFGANTEGQITMPQSTEERQPQLAPISDVVAISSGWRYNCALHGDGLLSCFGRNLGYQLGGIPAEGTRRVLHEGLNVVSASTALAAGCAVSADGSVRCWGMNNEGALGAGHDEPFAQTPELVVELSDALTVDGTRAHICALKRDGTAVCWGRNSDGQLGDQTQENSNSPVQVLARDGEPLRDLVGIKAGGAYSCAVTRDGQVLCWGDNSGRVLGASFDGARSLLPVVVVGLDH
jgi:alpha-tubulin suppressor-like RCC1 family protein